METERLTLGRELRRRREARGIELHEISMATRIAPRFLRAIEEDNFAALPGGLFTRSFIRAYARYVGMNEEEAISRYYEQTGHAQQEIMKPPVTAIAAQRARSAFVTRLVVGVFIGGVLALGGYAGWHYWQRRGRPPLPEILREQREPPSPVPSPPPVVDVGERAAASPRGEVAHVPSQPTPLEIRLEATGNCWISVQVDDEPKPRQEMLRAGDVRLFTPQKQVRLSIGSVPSLKVTINGKPARLPSVGHVARGVIITPENAEQFLVP